MSGKIAPVWRKSAIVAPHHSTVRQLTAKPLLALKPSALIFLSNTDGVFCPASFSGEDGRPFRGLVVSALVEHARRLSLGKLPQS